MKFRLQEKITDLEFNTKDPSYLGKVSDDIARDIFELINSLIIEPIDEQFTSRNSESLHFRNHCLGKTNRKSNHNTVYYDFKTLSEYHNYENIVDRKCVNSDIVIPTLTDTPTLLNAFRKLFEGNVTIEFSKHCGFKNKYGEIIICIHAFASEVTENYQDANTVDLVVLSTNYRTISLYPLDAYYLESKLNNIISKYNNNKKVRLAFNH